MQYTVLVDIFVAKYCAQKKGNISHFDGGFYAKFYHWPVKYLSRRQTELDQLNSLVFARVPRVFADLQCFFSVPNDLCIVKKHICLLVLTFTDLLLQGFLIFCRQNRKRSKNHRRFVRTPLAMNKLTASACALERICKVNLNIQWISFPPDKNHISNIWTWIFKFLIAERLQMPFGKASVKNKC